MFEKSPGYVSQTNISANKQSKRTLKNKVNIKHTSKENQGSTY